MTLFEAIRELKEGQAIVDSGEHSCREGIFYRWEWGREGIDEPGCQNYRDYSIIDLPKPKMSLEEGLERYLFDKDYFSDGAATRIARYLRSLPIDWQAEADRKDNLK